MTGKGRLRNACLFLAAAAAGCTAPPSVSPLLRLAERAVREEAARLEADSSRDAARVDQARASLEAGFDSDLAERDALTSDWVKDAAEGYAAAREALARHEVELRQERATRADNLRAAAEAQARALELIERQYALITGVTGLDFWRFTFRRPLSGPAPEGK